MHPQDKLAPGGTLSVVRQCICTTPKLALLCTTHELALLANVRGCLQFPEYRGWDAHELDGDVLALALALALAMALT